MPNKSSPHGAPISEGAISSGTLRTQDLLRTFAGELKAIMPFNGARLANEALEAADAIDANPDAQVAQMTGNDILQEMFAEMEAIAGREGMIFGSSEGDGACFGFWNVEGEE